MIGPISAVAWALSGVRAAEDPLGPVDQSPEAARDLACDLTASSQVCSPPEPSAPDFEFAAGGGSGSLGSLAVILLVIALVVVVVWIVVSIVGTDIDVEADDEDLDEDLDDVVAERIVDVERPPDRWRRAAVEHRDAGRFREAVRCEYRALVGDLARAGHVDEIPGRTSGEEREQVRLLAPGVAAAFDLAADIFDAAWFDDVEVTADQDQRFVDAATAVLGDVLAGARVQRGRDLVRR